MLASLIVFGFARGLLHASTACGSLWRGTPICLVAGDNQSGYYTVDLKYEGVALDRLDLQSLRSVAGDAKSQLLYDEIDVEAGYFVHRFLFWPYRSVHIYFRTVQLHKSPRPARLPFERAVRYLELGAPDL